MKLKFFFFIIIVFVKTYGQNDSISVTMPDKTIFKISLQENKLLEKYKAQPEKYDFKTETELLDRFKVITLKKREIAKIKAVTEKREQNIAQTEKETEQIEKHIAQTEKETEQIEKHIAQTEKETEQIRAETEQIRAEKEQLQQKLSLINQDIKDLDNQFKELFEKQLGRKVTEQEREKYYEECLILNKNDLKIKEIIANKNIVEAKKYLEKIRNQKKSDLPFINTFYEILKSELEKLIK